MLRLIHRTTALFAMLGLFAAGAFAQLPTVEVPELESERLVDEGLLEAQILDADYDARTLTLRLERNDETVKAIVPEDAEIFVTGANNTERRVDLNTLRPGDTIHMEAFEVEGVIRYRIVTFPAA